MIDTGVLIFVVSHSFPLLCCGLGVSGALLEFLCLSFIWYGDSTFHLYGATADALFFAFRPHRLRKQWDELE